MSAPSEVKTGLSDRERRLMAAAFEAGCQLMPEDLYNDHERKQFNEWLGEVISDSGHTVEEYVSSTHWDSPAITGGN